MLRFLMSTPRPRPPRTRHPRRRASAATAAAAPYTKPATAPPTDTHTFSSSSTTPMLMTRPTTPSPTAMASNFSTVRFRDFAQRGQISDHVLRGIPFEFCTHVQAATLDVVLQGTDVYVGSCLVHLCFIDLMTVLRVQRREQERRSRSSYPSYSSLHHPAFVFRLYSTSLP